MITDAVLYVLQAIISAVGAVFPVADLTDWPSSGTSVGSWVGTNTGPVNAVMPISELVTFIDFTILKWLPAVLIYQGVMWAYKHIPVVGAG